MTDSATNVLDGSRRKGENAREGAIGVLRDLVSQQSSEMDSTTVNLHKALNYIEYQTIEFRSDVVRSGFNDFLGCFKDCPYQTTQDRREWAEGYLMASTSPYVNANKDHFSGCPFEDAESIVASVLGAGRT